MPEPLRAPVWILVTLLGLGFALQMYGLADRSLNTDEVYLALAAREGRVAEAVAADVHPPLYPLIVQALVRLRLPEIAWRALSALAWLGVAWFAFMLGRRAGGDLVGLIALLLLLTSPQGIMLGRLARSYAVAALLGAATIYLFLRLLEEPSPPRAGLYGIAALLGCYTFYYNVYLLVALGAVGLLRRKHNGWPAVIASAAAGLLFAPWTSLLLVQAKHGGLGAGWITWSPAPLRIVRRFAQVLAGGGVDGLEPGLRAVVPSLAGAGATAIVLALFGLGAWRLFAFRKQAPDPNAWTLPLIAALSVGLALAAHYLIGAFVAVHYFAVFAAAIAPALVAPLVFARRRTLGGICVGLLLVLNFAQLPALYRDQGEPLHEASDWIDQHLSREDLVLGVAWFAVDGYSWYGHGRDSLGVPCDLRGNLHVLRAQPGVADARALSMLRRRLRDRARVAVLLTHETWRGTDRGKALVGRALREEGFTPVSGNGWPFGAPQPTVRAVIWQRH